MATAYQLEWCGFTFSYLLCDYIFSDSYFFCSCSHHFDFFLSLCVCWLHGNYHRFAVIRNSFGLALFCSWRGCNKENRMVSKKFLNKKKVRYQTHESLVIVISFSLVKFSFWTRKKIHAKPKWNCKSRNHAPLRMVL